jgi:O-Antigen ligase
MTLYYVLLFVTPFHSDPRLGVALFDPGGVLMATPVRALGLLAVAAALLAPQAANNAPRLRNPLPWLFVPFALVPVIETVAFGLPAASGELGQLISAALFLIATRPLLRTRERMLNATRTLVVAFAFSSLWVYKQHFIQHVSRAYGVEGEANYEALMLLVSLPMAFWMWRHERSSLCRRIGLGCGLLLAGGVLLTESRAGIIAGGVIGLLAALRGRHKFLAVGLLGAAALIVSSYGPAGLTERFRSIQVSGEAANADEGSSRLHVELIKAGLNMMESHPVFGVGMGQFKAVAPLYNPEISRMIKGSYIAHDTFIQIGAECGIPELLLFIAMIGYALHNFQIGEQRSDKTLAALCAAMRLALIGVCAASLTQSVQLLPSWILIFLSQNLREVAVAVTPPSIHDRVAA